MPAWSDQPETAFKDSCCDGGATSIEQSAQPCGCDPGANWMCRVHLLEGVNASTGVFDPTPSTRHTVVRKHHPVATGVLDYFPDAIREIAHVSWAGNQQHHSDKPLHWDRSKSTDEADALMRHFLDRGTRDTDGMRHSAKVAWRALALLQKEIEAGEHSK